VSAAKSNSATGTTGTAESPGRYRGRFAPSPTGPLHFGSLVAALGSYLEARTRAGEWLVRIEDLDPPRERPGAADRILRQLEALELHWDGEVLYQSRRGPAYEAALDALAAVDLTRRCSCSRSALAALPENSRREPGEELFHPADCIWPLDPGHDRHALRFRAGSGTVRFEDRCQGPQRWNVATSVGDFVLRRRDGLMAYQLAVTVDDAAQEITDVVRGADLLSSTPRQLLLQAALDFVHPSYMHLPLAVGDNGLKLSKSDDAPALATAAPGAQLVAALRFLRQEPPPALSRCGPGEVLEWALGHWRPERFSGIARQPVDPTLGNYQEETK
jgi:glutamyl-Q tRNA(Asp) synthetase